MMKSKLKKILASFLTAAMAISILPFTAFENEKVSAAVTNFLKDEDIITISPAENWDSDCKNRITLNDSNGWSLNIQGDNYSNGKDVHMWQNGGSYKFRVWHYNKNSSAPGAFWLHAVKTSEETTNRFVDVEDRSTSGKANIHLWEENKHDKNNDEFNSSSKWLQIEDDGDSDSHTFYIKNVRANKYLVPENYFNTDKNYKGRQCLANEKNTVLSENSDQKFKWRIDIVNTPPEVTDYLQNNDIVTISPGKNYTKDEKGNFVRTPKTLHDSDGWSLTVQDNNVANGNDLQMWQYGVSDKLKICNYDTKSGAFWLCAVNWRETPSSRYVDVEGKSTEVGANIHVWASAGDNRSKRFQIVDDGDSDPETFYIKNVYSGLYLAPEDFFTASMGYDDRQCLSEGKNTVLSNQAFTWKVEVVNRTPDSVKSQREWMKNIDGSTPLSAINIPGTHDACTANVEGSWNESCNFVACQKYFIREQLEVGVRAFDLRMLYKDGHDGGLIMLHGSSPFVCHTEDTDNNAKNLKFEDVMAYYKDYLEKHPSETIIVTFKHDSDSNFDKTVAEFKNVLAKYNKTDDKGNIVYDENGKPINTLMFDWDTLSDDKSVPTLDEVRGKVVGFSRMSGVTGGIYGPDLSGWDDIYDPGKSSNAQLISVEDTTPEVYIQDNYSTSSEPKIEYVFNTVKDANNPDSKGYSQNVFLFNYTSATTPTPLNVARIVNQYIRTDAGDNNFYKFIRNQDRLGITVMDYVDAQLAKMIYQSNGKYGGNSEEYIDSLIKGTSDKSSAVSNYASAKAAEDNTSSYNGENFTFTVTWPTVDPL
ncbi:MAG: phosphatidylinositol-specific phospholipase C domain-containing protein, partial [Porcipelethomonas sp.]